MTLTPKKMLYYNTCNSTKRTMVGHTMYLLSKAVLGIHAGTCIHFCHVQKLIIMTQAAPQAPRSLRRRK